MSLILKGIDMPMETDYLRLALLRSGRDNEVLVFDDETNALIGQAIQVPFPHGRLEDVDELKSIKSIQSADFNSIEAIQKWIDNAPTILEAEEQDESRDAGNGASGV